LIPAYWAQKDRIDAFGPNEARDLEGLDGVAYKDEPRVQQQVVPLSAAAYFSVPAAPPAPAAASVAAPARC